MEHEAAWRSQTRETMCLRLRVTKNKPCRSPKILQAVRSPTLAPEDANAGAELESHQRTLIEVVQSVGEYINDEDEKIRARAVSYLTAIISTLSAGFLSRQQINVLCDFLCARIEDGGAIEGLSHLQGLHRFTGAMAQTVVTA